MSWEDVLWQEMNELPPADRFIELGKLNTFISQVLLTRIATARRLAVAEALAPDAEGNKIDVITFAEMVGAGPNAIKRLVDDARSLKKQAGRGVSVEA